MTIGDWLTRNRMEIPEGEAILLLSFVLRRDKSSLIAHPEHAISKEQGTRLENCVERRKKHEPFSYITGEKEFFGLPFFVTPATLIPRPETEILVEQVLKRISKREYRILKEGVSLIDIGTGSGCIPVSILATLHANNSEMLPHIQCLATDVSLQALAVAKRNAEHHGVAPRINFKEGDLLSDIPESYFRTHSLIITANLPYLSKEIYDTSPEDVRLYEPQSALQGDHHDGTTLIKELLKQCQQKISLQSPFLIILEISPEQDTFLLGYGKGLFPQSNVHLLLDLSGRNRFLIIENN
ncbi:MAG: peptide chain release factor N(5)-glutamine methyltransferase [Candidatus Moraniibacteriota bacterium]